MSKVLITGGLGVLGQALSDYLRCCGYHVIQTGRHMPTDQNFLHLDVLDLQQATDVIQAVKPNIIVHLAATFENDFETAFAVNVVGAKNMLAAVKASGCDPRVILAGSAAEYGFVSPEENPIKENKLLRPVSIYGLTKSWQSNWGLMCAHQGQDVMIARIFNLDAQGLSQRLFIGRINQQITEVLEGKRTRIEIGSLAAIRDYISLEQAAKQLLAIIKHGQSGKIYHVASGQGITMRELLVQQLSSHSLNFNIVDENPDNSKRSGYDVPVIYADINSTKALLCME